MGYLAARLAVCARAYVEYPVSQASLDNSKAAYDSAVNNVKFARSQVKLAKRDLEKTILVAPFNGVIGEKYVYPFQEVESGTLVKK